MNISNSECTSECESGWTMYFDEFSYSEDKCNRVMGINVHNIDEEVKNEDLSMVSDASSGPPHFSDDKECSFEENGYVFYPSAYEKQRRKMKEQSGKQQNVYDLDDTASSPVSSFSKDNTSLYDDTTFMEQVADKSGTYSKSKSVLGKHFDFLKTSVKGKASSEKSGFLKGRKKG